MENKICNSGAPDLCRYCTVLSWSELILGGGIVAGTKKEAAGFGISYKRVGNS